MNSTSTKHPFKLKANIMTNQITDLVNSIIKSIAYLNVLDISTLSNEHKDLLIQEFGIIADGLLYIMGSTLYNTYFELYSQPIANMLSDVNDVAKGLGNSEVEYTTKEIEQLGSINEMLTDLILEIKE